jgi:hypothetical protein
MEEYSLPEIFVDWDDLFAKHTRIRIQGDGLPEYDSVATDSFGEVIDKLVITHIRYWMIEDLMATTVDDAQLASLRRKSESLFKEKRPMLVTALDKMIFDLVNKNVVAVPENVKQYKGWQN